MKSYIWIGGIIVILIALMFLSAGGSDIKPLFKVDAVHPLDNVKGNASSSVLIIEYSDFECPACRTYYTIMRELLVEFGDKTTFVYRHFPLIGIHANAEFAARAAEAASKQGKFWEMHDLLFEKQNEWAKVADVEPMFESYAVLLGISVEQFKTDWQSKAVKDFVKVQRSNATKLGLQGTPSFFINGKIIQNPNSVDAFRAVIKEALGN
ncbi:MAG: thioredoxin domain-containing protein [Patescibacteria group bacterium]